MKYIAIIILLLSTINIFAQPENIMISSDGSPNEPSIFINTENPALIMAATNINKMFISQDTGRTWTHTPMTSNYGVWGDPAIITDTSGNFLYFHLANPPSTQGHWIDRIVCQKYNVSQQQWTVDTFMGLDGRDDYAQDKEWIAIDRTNNTVYSTWTQFDNYGSTAAEDSSNIMFSKSIDGGQSWSSAIIINETPGDCIDSDNTTEGAVPCVGPNGEIYVSWAGPDGLVFDKSTDGGATWLTNDIFVNSFTGGWDYDISGISRCNGLPITDCDISGGAHHGTIYINWSDQSNGSDNTDIWLAKSTDGGSTWSSAIKVNNDTTQTQQFLTWMDIDQSTGYLYFVFYDRSNYDDERTDVVLAISKDGGQSFDNYTISESPFTPTDQVFFGDYTNISVQDGIIRPIWARFDLTNYMSVWTAIINPETVLSIKSKPLPNDISSNVYPNPTSEIAFFSFKIRNRTTASLNVIDNNGRIISKIFENKQYEAGKYVQDINIKENNISAGVYYFQFISKESSYIKKFIVK